MDGTTERAEEILAAAITLRDSSGRDRKDAVQGMATTWDVARCEQFNDTLTNRSVAALRKDIETAVCDAALKW